MRVAPWLLMLGMLSALMLFTSPGGADERTDFYIEMQQREYCEDLGGEYDGIRCYLPDSDSGGSAAPVWVKNAGGCTFHLLVAYVPPGERRYRVDGWWVVEPTYWSGYKIQGDDGPILHDGDYPLYFYVEDESNERFADLPRIASFEFDGDVFEMGESKWGLVDSGYWVGGAYC